jgi:uncharacterized damage-inducible protein DinB
MSSQFPTARADDALDIHRVARQATWRAVESPDPALLSKTPAGGGWSLLQVLEHLHAMETLTVQRLREAEPLEGRPTPDLSVALDLGRRLEAPAAVRPRGAFATLADARRGLEESSTKLRQAFAEAVASGRADTHGLPHPVFGAMSIRQRYEAVALHELRHLYQIYRILGRV